MSDLSKQVWSYYPSLCRFAKLSLLINRESINGRNHEDIASEAIVKALENIHTFKIGTNMKAWLFQICKNQYISNWRKNYKGDTCVNCLPSEDLVFIIDNNVKNAVENDFYTIEKRDVIETALLQIGVDNALSIALTMQGYKCREVAAETNTKVDTVKSRLFRGRNQLRKNLALREYAMAG